MHTKCSESSKEGGIDSHWRDAGTFSGNDWVMLPRLGQVSRENSLTFSSASAEADAWYPGGANESHVMA